MDLRYVYFLSAILKEKAKRTIFYNCRWKNTLMRKDAETRVGRPEAVSHLSISKADVTMTTQADDDNCHRKRVDNHSAA